MCVRSERVLARSSGGSLVLLHLDSGEYFSTNDVGAVIWELTDGSRSVSAITEAVAAEYEVELAVVQADVLELAGQMFQASLFLLRED